MKKKSFKMETALVLVMFFLSLSPVYFLIDASEEKKKVINEIKSLAHLYENIEKTDVLESYRTVSNESLISDKIITPSYFRREVFTVSPHQINSKYYRVKEKTCLNFLDKIKTELKDKNYLVSVNNFEISKIKAMGYEVCSMKRNTIEVVLSGLKSKTQRENEELISQFEKEMEQLRIDDEYQKKLEREKIQREKRKKRMAEEAKLRQMEEEREYLKLITPVTPADIQLKFTTVTPLEKEKTENINSFNGVIENDLIKEVIPLAHENDLDTINIENLDYLGELELIENTKKLNTDETMDNEALIEILPEVLR